MARAASLVTGLLLGVCAQPWQTWAGRPLTVDDAEPVAPGALEMEVGLRHFDADGADYTDIPAGFTFGILPGLEAGVGTGAIWTDEPAGTTGGIADLSFGTKWKFLTRDQAWADHSVSAGAKAPIADADRFLGSGEWDFSLLWVATRPINDQWSAHVNLGYTWFGGSHDAVQYGGALDYLVHQNVQLVAEVYGLSQTRRSSETAILINAGVRWWVTDALALDAAVGTGLHGATPNLLATAGLTWTFQLRKSPK